VLFRKLNSPIPLPTLSLFHYATLGPFKILHSGVHRMRKTLFATLALLCTAVLSATPQQNISDEAGRVLALEKAWNLALEEKNTKALDMLLANTMQSIDIDGSIASKSEFLASIKSPDYQPSQWSSASSASKASHRGEEGAFCFAGGLGLSFSWRNAGSVKVRSVTSVAMPRMHCAIPATSRNTVKLRLTKTSRPSRRT
jgi:hypothetical protein